MVFFHDVSMVFKFFFGDLLLLKACLEYFFLVFCLRPLGSMPAEKMLGLEMCLTITQIPSGR